MELESLTNAHIYREYIENNGRLLEFIPNHCLDKIGPSGKTYKIPQRAKILIENFEVPLRIFNYFLAMQLIRIEGKSPGGNDVYFFEAN